MNEEQKNIETCLAENILSEVANVPTDPQFRSLVEESFDPLQQQALQQAGYDGYKKVVWTHKPYTFTSSVKQMKSNLILLLRRLWRYPFGRGTTASSAAGSSASDAAAAPIRSLADMWQHYITRLKGNPEYGIPSRLDQLTDLPDAPALLTDRDMSSGIRFGTNPLPDGMSLAQLLCSASASSVTEIVDTNVGWIFNKSLLSYFPSLKRLTLGCKEMYTPLGNISNLTLLRMQDLELFDNYNGQLTSGEYQGTTADFRKLKETYSGILVNAPYLTENPFRDLETIHPRYGYQSMTILGNTAIDTIDLPNLKTVNASGGCGIIQGGSVRVIKCEALESCTSNYKDNSAYSAGLIAGNLPNLEELWLGKLVGTGYITPNSSVAPVTPKLLKVVLGEGTSANIGLSNWSPTLDDSNLQQFLSNFKTYIAERLTDKGTGKTLTLSQEVRNAIHAAESTYGIENIIITQKGWTISPAPN